MKSLNFLSQGLDYKDFEIQDFLYSTPGLSCDVALAQNIRTNQKFLVKIVGVVDKDHEANLQSEVDLLNKINMHPFKPKSLPQYFGYAKTQDPKKITYNFVYENLEVNMKKTIKAKTIKNEAFDFEQIERIFTALLNTLAFLQQLEIVPSRFDSDGLFHNNKDKILKILDFTPQSEFLLSLKRHTSTNRNPVYLPPEVLKYLDKESKESASDGSPEKIQQNDKKDIINPHKVSTYSLAIFALELLTLETPKGVKTIETDIMRLLTEANIRYSSYKNPMQLKEFLQLLRETLRTDPKERMDCRELFWRNTEMRNGQSMRANSHLMHHIFIEDGDCSELKLFNELKSKGKPFKLQDSQNPNDEFFGLGQKTLQGEFSDKNSLMAHLLEIKPLRGVNIRTTKGNLEKEFRFWDDAVLGKENWDLENFPVKKVVFQANVHEKLIDDEYKKYYYNVFMKSGIKTNEISEEGAVKILHQHDWNFMEGVYDEQVEPILKRLDDFVRGNNKLEKLSLMIQRLFLLFIYKFYSLRIVSIESQRKHYSTLIN